MFTPHSPRDEEEIEHLRRQVTGHLLTEGAIASILRVALEPVPLEDQLHRILALLVKLPWLAVEAKGWIYRVEGEPPELVMAAQVGFAEGVRSSHPGVPPGRCLCGQAVAPADRIAGCRRSDPPGSPPHDSCCVPITRAGRQIGLLGLALREGHERTPDEERFLRAAADVIAGVIGCKTVEETLRHSEERFELAVRGTDAGIWDWDLRTNATYFSPRWKSMLGYEEGELADDFSEWEARLHPDDREHAHGVIRDYLEGKTARYELEHRLRHKDGSYRWIVARAAKVCDGRGKPYRVVGSHLDITDRKRVEEQLRDRVAHLIAVRKIVRRLLPRASLHAPGVEVHGISVPADYASGDHFDYFTRPDGSVVVVIADVAGHGIDAAILMTMTHAWLRAFAGLGLGIGETLTRLNAVLIEQTDGDRFVTLAMLRIDPGTREMVFSNAGHPPGYVLGKDGALKSTLDSLSMPLVIDAGETFPVGEPVTLGPGDLVLLTTDGVIEARSPGGELFGSERALQAVRERIGRPNEEILNGLHAAVLKFTGPRGLADDVTAVLVKIV